MSQFVHGLDLSRAFSRQLVGPLLGKHYPQLQYSSALIGGGSEVLAYDDEISTDHNWGPRLQLFLAADDLDALGAEISLLFRRRLPHMFAGYPVNFSAPVTAADDRGTQHMWATSQGEVNHRVELHTIDGFVGAYLGLSLAQRLGPADWLSLPQQRLLGFTAGGVFHDELGIQLIRDRFAWYPRDVWLYLLACAWSRIGQDEHLAPRAGDIGDELGSALIAGRLVRSIMLLCFLLEERYAPYPKWLGRAFAELDCGPALGPILRSVQLGADFRSRERHLCAAYEQLNMLHNDLGLTQPIGPAVADFHARGFKVSHAWRYCQALVGCISDADVKAIASGSLIGSIDLFSDSTDLREAVTLRPAIAALFSA